MNKKQRQRKAWKMRLDGYSVTEIAEKLGFDKSTISVDLKEPYAKYMKDYEEEAHQLIVLEQQRLNEMIQQLRPMMAQGDKEAFKIALQVMQRRSRLLGLDAPAKQQVQISTPLSTDQLAQVQADLLQQLEQLPKSEG